MSNFSKFKRGDRIETVYGGVGTVISTSKSGKSFQIVIKLDDSVQTTYNQDDIKFYSRDFEEKKVRNYGDSCPRCFKKWHKTRFGAKVWLDCLSCEKTAEELITAKKPIKVEKDSQEEFDFGDHDSRADDPLGWWRS